MLRAYFVFCRVFRVVSVSEFVFACGRFPEDKGAADAIAKNVANIASVASINVANSQLVLDLAIGNIFTLATFCPPRRKAQHAPAREPRPPETGRAYPLHTTARTPVRRKPDAPILRTHGLMPPTDARLTLDVTPGNPVVSRDRRSSKEKIAGTSSTEVVSVGGIFWYNSVQGDFRQDG